MKCPCCDYIDGWDADLQKRVVGESGGFYSLSNEVTAKRTVDGFNETLEVYGCPACNNLFMDD